MELIVKLSGIFLGVFARMVVPYVRKLKQNKINSFDKKYLRIGLASFLLSIIVTLLVFPQFSSHEQMLNFETGFKLFCIAFGFGFGFNSVVSEFSKWGEGKR